MRIIRNSGARITPKRKISSNFILIVRCEKIAVFRDRGWKKFHKTLRCNVEEKEHSDLRVTPFSYLNELIVVIIRGEERI